MKPPDPLPPFTLPLLAALSALLLLSAPAAAHQPGTSSLVLAASGDGSLRGEVHVADVDLAAIELMLTQRSRRAAGGGVSRGTATARELPWLRLSADGRDIALEVEEPRPAETDGRIHTMVPFVAQIGAASELAVTYAGFFEFDPRHKVVTSLEAGGETRVGLLSYADPHWTVSLQAPGTLGQFAHFTWEGVWHIWIGIDHILFLLALLLPSVLSLQNGRWVPVPGFRRALANVVKVVTAFTVAHSVTLSLAALHLVALPAKWVESVIAISVLLAALNNIKPLVSERVWMVAFGFGLVHGFGFANVLADLQLPSGTLAVALVSFNLGVELGQLAIVSVFFPVAFALRDHALYQPLKLRLGSALIGVVAVGWIVQRVFEVEVMPF